MTWGSHLAFHSKVIDILVIQVFLSKNKTNKILLHTQLEVQWFNVEILNYYNGITILTGLNYVTKCIWQVTIIQAVWI